MKTIMKRTVSLILTLCLLMTVLVPAVWAAGPVATVDGVEYTTRNDANNAIAAIKEEDPGIVVIHGTLKAAQASTNAKSITVEAGATWDMNGKTVTASNAIVNVAEGGKISNSHETSDGGLIAKELTIVGDNGGYLPVCSSEKWRFFKAAITVVDLDTSVANTAKLKFRVVLTRGDTTTQAAYGTYLKDANTNIGGMFTWTAGGIQNSDKMLDISYADGVSLANQWGAEVVEKGAGNANNGAIVLTFSGLDSFDALSMTPYIRSSTGVVIKADVQTLKSAG